MIWTSPINSHLVRINLFNHSLKTWHKARSKMAVLEEHPFPSFHGRSHHSLSSRSLTYSDNIIWLRLGQSLYNQLQTDLTINKPLIQTYISSVMYNYTLSKRDGRQFLTKLHVLSKLVQICCRIRTRRENKDERSGRRRVFVYSTQICRLQ